MVERPAMPTVSFAVFIRTGGIDDDGGKSGLAHMFEHMLFKGSKIVGTKNYEKEKPLLRKIDQAAVQLQRAIEKGAGQDRLHQLEKKLKELQKKHEDLIEQEEFWKIYEQAGGVGLNAGTGYDYTVYTISLPANRVPLWMAMEADRIKNPVLREFYKERDVVLEERRMRVDNSPRGKLWENFLATAYHAHPYGRPIIGWPDEVSRLTVQDAQDFFDRYYDISRLVFVIVGGIDGEQVEKMVRHHFGSIKSRPNNFLPKLTDEPDQEGERRIYVNYPAEPSLMIGYHRPDFKHPDTPALEILSDILSTGKTSRFNRTIVEKKQIGVSAWSGATTPGEREHCLFVLGGSPRDPHTAEDLEQAMYDELEKMKKDGPTDRELEKVKNFSIEYILRQLSSNAGLARMLGYYEAVAGDWQFFLELIKNMQNVTKEDVMRVANEYLVPSNRTVAILVKEEEKK